MLAERVQRIDATELATHIQHRLNRAFADVFDCTQTKADAAIHDREGQLARIEVGRQDRDAKVAALSQVHRELVGVGGFDSQQRRHEMRRVIGLEIRRLIRHPRIGGRVRLVESVAGEELHQVEDLGGFLFADSVLDCPRDERFALLRHDFGILLSHSLSKHVGLAHGEAGQHRGDTHDLFLIRDDTIGVLENRRELRQLVFDFGLPLLAGNVIIDHSALERTGTIEGVQGNQVVQPFGLRLAQQFTHAGAFELEHAVGLAVAEQLKRFRVVQRNGVDIEIDRLGAADFVECVADQRERAEAEEVHLEEAHAFDLLHCPLRDDFVLLALVERNELGQRPRRDHHAGGMHRRMTGHALEASRDGEQLLDPLVLLLHLFQDGVFLERFGQRHIERRRDRLRHLVGIGVGDVHHPRHVADDGPGLHRPERDDLGDVFAAVLVRDVLDDLAAAALAEIDVDVGQRHPLGIEEALEDQIVLNRVDIGDPQAIRDEASSR